MGTTYALASRSQHTQPTARGGLIDGFVVSTFQTAYNVV